jgi:hypothetical protein
MSFVHSKNFKYLKNLLIGVGASVVMIGAMGKLNSAPGVDWRLLLDWAVEAFIFLFLRTHRSG